MPLRVSINITCLIKKEYTMTRNLSVWNSLRPFSVGFDSIFEEFDRMLDSSDFNSNYPPYNIKKIKEDVIK